MEEETPKWDLPLLGLSSANDLQFQTGQNGFFFRHLTFLTKKKSKLSKSEIAMLWYLYNLTIMASCPISFCFINWSFDEFLNISKAVLPKKYMQHHINIIFSKDSKAMLTKFSQ